MAEQVQIQSVKRKHEDALLAKPNVVGVGIGYKTTDSERTDQLSIVTMVRVKIPPSGLPAGALLPKRVDGVPVDVVEVGTLRAFQSPTDRWRPAPGGVSIGHYQITAGTLGTVVRDRVTGARLILSNNHVLANSNAARQGDAILQPGAADGGENPADIIGYLERFIAIDFGTEPPTCPIANGVAGLANLLARLFGSKHRLKAFQSDPAATNLVDAALARPVDDGAVLDEILEIGVVHGTTAPILGMTVRKSGRTTGLTTGTITVLDATVTVTYGLGRDAWFENQIVSTAMSEGGDSGSLLVTGDPPSAVGLLFAGSPQATIYNPIQAVLANLEIVI